MGVSQANIDQIMDIVPDFTREQVVNALRVTDDNIDQAVDLLFSVRALF
jgi:UBA/TS-N domain